MAAMKRARMARAMVTAMRVPVDKEGKGGMGHGVGNKGVQLIGLFVFAGLECEGGKQYQQNGLKKK